MHRSELVIHARVVRSAADRLCAVQFLEESLKFFAVGWFYSYAWVADPRALVLYAAAAGAGFAAFENLQYLWNAWASVQLLGGGAFSSQHAADDAAQAALVTTAVLRAGMAIPLHVGCALIMGARLGQDRFLGRVPGTPDRGALAMWFSAVSWPTFFHGTYDFLLMGGPEFLVTPSGPPWPWYSPYMVGCIKLLGIPTVMVCMFLRARWDYVKLAAVPRVDIRDLQARGVIPRATLKGWLMDGLLCCNWPCQFCCKRCREENDRLMRLSMVYRAQASGAGGAPAAAPYSAVPVPYSMMPVGESV